MSSISFPFGNSPCTGAPSVSDVTFTTAGTAMPHRLECDGVVFTGGFTPNAEFIRAAEVQFNFATRGPSINQLFQTSRPWLFAAGNCLRGVVSGDEAALEGRMAASDDRRFSTGHSTAKMPETFLRVDRLWRIVARTGSPQTHDGVRSHSNLAQRTCDQRGCVVWHGTDRIWSKRFRRVQPGRRLFIPVDQLTSPDSQNPFAFLSNCSYILQHKTIFEKQNVW